ncbi:ATP-binding protein [Microbacterium hominis]|uniref:Lipoprotein n=1 Tax=Microbacterium hominis TaxID=162426 RepID=A0A7D4Q0G5_9MICO|nr:hypothetical protein [Microbacterium hominis]QKJ18958.1 hypothetical protein HQM25_05895 [Microbacterium hominis]
MTMMRLRTMGAAVMLAGVIAVSAACATSGGETGMEPVAQASPSPRATPPNDTEIAVACGLDVVRELADEAYYPSRADAIAASLDYHRTMGTAVQESTHLPYALYVELLEAALQQLPEHEREVDAVDTLSMTVTDDGREVGTVEVSPNINGRYGLTGLGFAPRDTALCDEYYVGDFEE